MVDRKLSAAYPAHWEADVVLRDGTTAHLRPITPRDAQALQEMHKHQSETSVYLRYFTYKSSLTPKELERFTNVDHTNRVAFTVVRGSKIIGVGRYDRLDNPREAEVAFNVSDEYQGTGIGSILLEHLAAAAREKGIEKFAAEVLPENRKMLTVFSEAGYAVARHFEDGVVMLEFSISPTEKAREVTESREHRAEASSVAGLLSPDSIAIVGASRTWGKLGHDVLERLIESKFAGIVYAVNDAALEVGGLVSYGKVSEIPGPVDVAVLCIPRERVLETIKDCAAHGVKALVIMSAGYESAEGLGAQRELVALARANGMRVVGPASLGLINTDPAVNLYASGSAGSPQPGNVGFFSQSAAMGMILQGVAIQQGIGVSSAISAGLRADVSGNDAMQFFEDDTRTDVVAMYLESFGNPRKFARIARRLARRKPVVVAKTDVMGRRLPPGHSVRVGQAPAGAMNAILRQSGVIRVRSSEELLDVSSLLSVFPPPQGPNVAVLSNSMTIAEVVCDVAETRNLNSVIHGGELDYSVGQSRALPMLRRRIQQLIDDPQVHTVVLAHLPYSGLETSAVLKVAREFLDQPKPVLALVPGLADTKITGGLKQGVPLYTSPTTAIGALAKAYGYQQWIDVPYEAIEEPEGIDVDGAADFLNELGKSVSGSNLLELTESQAQKLLGFYGIEIFGSRVVNTVSEAIKAADELGWPVALKANDPDLRQRLDLGGVRLSIPDRASLESNFTHMKLLMKTYGVDALEVQSMAPAGQACVLKAVEDPLLGPVISFGLSGDPVNLLDDWAHGVAPLSAHDLEQLIRRPRSSVRLLGYQGLAAVDLEALKDFITRVSLFKDNHPEITVAKFAPISVSADSLSVLSVNIQISNAEQRIDSVRRALRS
ncbi:GNAT family N-acetyltransferase [Glutamicibacter sp. M10]|uniref:bifunctional acetate--CoA ligase family protein/GNAT family N-acetyltransferase n=1 Tax=Glutamicibacter sp. M10 TaxID=3023076 RepID=UPI0021CA93AD|nr:GNAT family N-acetyltransferase [Glutamicibacter sp. M10]UXN30717.1 GNAT family N-acetyltransferase [Glutamicibacter sp. M10]